MVPEEKELLGWVVVTCCEAHDQRRAAGLSVRVRWGDESDKASSVRSCSPERQEVGTTTRVRSSSAEREEGGVLRWRREALFLPLVVRDAAAQTKAFVDVVDGDDRVLGSRGFALAGVVSGGGKDERVGWEGGSARVGLGFDLARPGPRVGDVVRPLVEGLAVRRLTVVDVALDRVLLSYGHLDADCRISLPTSAVVAIPSRPTQKRDDVGWVRPLVGRLWSRVARLRSDDEEPATILLGRRVSSSEPATTNGGVSVEQLHQQTTTVSSSTSPEEETPRSKASDDRRRQPLGLPVASLLLATEGPPRDDVVGSRVLQ